MENKCFAVQFQFFLHSCDFWQRAVALYQTVVVVVVVATEKAAMQGSAYFLDMKLNICKLLCMQFVYIVGYAMDISLNRLNTENGRLYEAVYVEL
jgi:hypothetical protein